MRAMASGERRVTLKEADDGTDEQAILFEGAEVSGSGGEEDPAKLPLYMNVPRIVL